MDEKLKVDKNASLSWMLLKDNKNKRKRVAICNVYLPIENCDYNTQKRDLVENELIRTYEILIKKDNLASQIIPSFTKKIFYTVSKSE